MNLHAFVPVASVAMLVAIVRPDTGVELVAGAVALVGTLPWGGIAGRVRRARQTAALLTPASDVDATFASGWECLQREAFIDAEQAFRQVLVIRPADIDATLYRGLALAGQERHAEAIPLLRAAVASRPLDADARMWLGISLAKEGEVFLAVTALREALTLRPGSRVAEQALAELISVPAAPDEAQTAPAHARSLRQGARRRAHRYTRRTMPGSSLELRAGA